MDMWSVYTGAMALHGPPDPGRDLERRLPEEEAYPAESLNCQGQSQRKPCSHLLSFLSMDESSARRQRFGVYLF
jgi:hypothetical protein